MSSNPIAINLVVSWDPGTNQPVVNKSQEPVGASPGDIVVITWMPAESGIEITSITGFPSVVSVEGPDANGNWMATYPAPANRSRWSYIVSASRNGSRVVRHDPEIDNTPPPHVG